MMTTEILKLVIRAIRAGVAYGNFTSEETDTLLAVVESMEKYV